MLMKRMVRLVELVDGERVLRLVGLVDGERVVSLRYNQWGSEQSASARGKGVRLWSLFSWQHTQTGLCPSVHEQWPWSRSE